MLQVIGVHLYYKIFYILVTKKGESWNRNFERFLLLWFLVKEHRKKYEALFYISHISTESRPLCQYYLWKKLCIDKSIWDHELQFTHRIFKAFWQQKFCIQCHGMSYRR